MLVKKSLILFNYDHDRRKEENSSLETSDKYTDVSLKLHYIFITAMWYVPQSNIWPGQARPYETVPIRIRTISSPSNGERKSRRQCHYGCEMKDTLACRVQVTVYIHKSLDIISFTLGRDPL